MDAPHRTRFGPRPLPLHLWASLAATAGARAAWPAAARKLVPWPPALADKAETVGAELARAIARGAGPAFATALDAEARRREHAFLSGVEAYRRHPYARVPAEAADLWREGTTRLVGYGAEGAPVVLVVPSLVNRAYVLDLDEGASLLRYLAAAGLRPLLVDWGAPGPAERRFTLSDYIAGRLSRALDEAVAVAGGPVPVVGYCMGGLLALAVALLRPGAVRGLAALATPWDFHAETGGPPPLLMLAAPHLAAWLDLAGELPVDVLQALFLALDPMQGWVKFRGFARLDPGSAEAARFVALEDWANDGVPLAGPVARECLIGWYLENAPARGAWRVAGMPVRPAALAAPALVVVPERDRIVPPASARALAEAIPGAQAMSVPSGHVGMVVGRRAEQALWRPLAGWLHGLTPAA